MFTGIVAAVGRIDRVEPAPGGVRLHIATGGLDMADVALGDSIAVNGVCLTVVAVDNTPGSVPLETAELPERCLLLFGQEGPGVTHEAQTGSSMTVSIAQFGSTRSINAGVAAGIAMHAWVKLHADLRNSW